MAATVTEIFSFPKTIAAAKALDTFADFDRHWALGKAAYEEIGPPGEDSANNKTQEKFRQLAKQFEKHGIKVTPDYTRQHRDVYAHFKDMPVKRLTGVKWSVLFKAGKPDRLERARVYNKKEDYQSLKARQVENSNKFHRLQEEKKDRDDHPALDGSDPELEGAVDDCEENIEKGGKLFDKAIAIITPFLDRLSTKTRGDLIHDFQTEIDKLQDFVALLQPSSYREAAE